MKEEKKDNILKRLLRKRNLVIAIIIAVVGFGIYKFFFANGDEVETTTVSRGNVEEELILSGVISADEYVKLSFPTSGQISWVGVTEGKEVKRGQALIKLDTTVLNTIFQQARASLREEEATVANIHDQVKDHSGDETYAQKDMRTAAEVAKDKAYEAYIAAEYNLRNATLVSPFVGIATYVAHPFSGVNVLATEVQVEVLNPETIYYDVSADQTEVIDLKLGQKVNIVLDSYPDEKIEGVVDFISLTPKANEVGSVYKVKVGFMNKLSDLQKFRIGMGGDAKFVLSEKEGVLYVPPEFVNSDVNGKYVNLDKGNNKRYVEVGIEGEDRVEIIGDVKEGDVVYD